MRAQLENEARKLGEEAAISVASWTVDRDSDEKDGRRVLEMMRAGDPAEDNYLPDAPNLSGEFADAPTPRR